MIIKNMLNNCNLVTAAGIQVVEFAKINAIFNDSFA